MILGGHDWYRTPRAALRMRLINYFRGGLIAARVAEYHPQIVAAIFSAGTPYLPVEPRWLEFSEYVEKYPTFKYQGYFGGSEFEKIFKTDEDIRQFMIAGFYGKGPNGELPFSTERPLFENWPILKRSEVISEDVMDRPLLQQKISLMMIGARILHSRICAAWHACTLSVFPRSSGLQKRSANTSH